MFPVAGFAGAPLPVAGRGPSMASQPEGCALGIWNSPPVLHMAAHRLPQTTHLYQQVTFMCVLHVCVYCTLWISSKNSTTFFELKV
jgi:hypothetical protein